MSDIKLDENWNLVIENGNLVLTSGVDAVKQRLSQRLKTFMGEWFLDRRKGVPYFEQVLKKNVDPIILGNVFKREIISTNGVIELTAFRLARNNRTRELSLSFTVHTTEGQLTFDEVLP